LGAFLWDRLTIEGDKGIVMTKNTNGLEHMTFKPRTSINMINMLQTLDWIEQQKNAHLSFAVDYKTAYYFLGHPSKEALRCTRENTTNFSKVKIPSNDPICPGYALGKMPNCPFSSSKYQAI